MQPIIIDIEFIKSKDNFIPDLLGIMIPKVENHKYDFPINFQETVVDNKKAYVYLSIFDPIAVLSAITPFITEAIDVLLIFHNYENDSKYLNIDNILSRIGLVNKLEFNVNKPSYYASVYYSSPFAGKVYIIDTAKFDYEPLHKNMSAIEAKTRGEEAYKEYLLNDLRETYKMFLKYRKEINKIINVLKANSLISYYIR